MSGRITCEVSRQWPAPDQRSIIPQQQNFMTELTHSHKELSSFTANLWGPKFVLCVGINFLISHSRAGLGHSGHPGPVMASPDLAPLSAQAAQWDGAQPF